jgi:hypothetical protein
MSLATKVDRLGVAFCEPAVQKSYRRGSRKEEGWLQGS